MKILHTSDWHLGRTLYEKKRYEEFECFLKWIIETIINKKIDILLISGDIFDTVSPSNQAQAMYYQFLSKIPSTCCRHVVITGGNHDSPTFLNAPQKLLKPLNIHVVGAITDNLEDEVIVLYDKNENPEAVVCAVPYLRDKDIRKIEAGETIDDKNIKLIYGVKKHYEDVCNIAEQKIKDFASEGYLNIPMIAMGHLFTAKGKTVDGDGVRDLYVGNLVKVEAANFPASIDYLALGHLHVSQIVGKKEHMRYSGSPIPMGFGEAEQDKKVISVEFKGKHLEIKDITVPCFQSLVSIKGSLFEISNQIEALKTKEPNAWIEVEYDGDATSSEIRDKLGEAINGSQMEIIRIKNTRVLENAMLRECDDKLYDDLKPEFVFERVLDTRKVAPELRRDLTYCYNKLVEKIQEEDTNAL